MLEHGAKRQRSKVYLQREEAENKPEYDTSTVRKRLVAQPWDLVGYRSEGGY
jgi:hypothetical protein